MPHHDWSEKEFDWAGLGKAIDIIEWWSTHIGRFGGQIKEKFGCVRFYAFFSDGTLYSLCKPGYYCIRWPKWLYWGIDYKIIRPIICKTGLIYLIRKWQSFIYWYAYKRAVDKYPHLRNEILCDADYYELLEGMHGFKHSDFWVTYTNDTKK